MQAYWRSWSTFFPTSVQHGCTTFLRCLNLYSGTILPWNHSYPVLTFGCFSGIAYLPVSIPSFFCFRAKLLSHQLMLEQMSTFDVRAARCTVASDRASIESQARAQGFSCCQDQAPVSIIFTQVSKGFKRQIIGIWINQRRFVQMTV